MRKALPSTPRFKGKEQDVVVKADGAQKVAGLGFPTPKRPPWRSWREAYRAPGRMPVLRTPPGAARPSGMRPFSVGGGGCPQLYPKVLAVLGEADLLQPGLDLSLLPAGHAGQDAPRHLLAQEAQRALGQRRRSAICGVRNQAFQALDGADVAEHLRKEKRIRALEVPSSPAATKRAHSHLLPLLTEDQLP